MTYDCQALHGDITQANRESTLTGFKKGSFKAWTKIRWKTPARVLSLQRMSSGKAVRQYSCVVLSLCKGYCAVFESALALVKTACVSIQRCGVGSTWFGMLSIQTVPHIPVSALEGKVTMEMFSKRQDHRLSLWVCCMRWVGGRVIS